MKASLRFFRLSRKVVFIITGTLLLSGAAGATALYIGRDALLGSSGGSVNGTECTSVRVTTIHKKDRFWIRKYIKTDGADGLTRVKTALRVAGAVFEKERPDLVQVIVLDVNGPEKRADMRGRAVGADVIFVAEPERLAATADMPQFTATYTDATASISGEFFGQKMSMDEDDIRHLVASISEKTDCFDPAAEAAAKAKSEEGKSAEGKTSKGESSGGETPSTEAKAGPEGSPDAPETEKPGAAKGWFASLKAKIFGADGAAEPAEAGKTVKGTTAETNTGDATAEAPEGDAKPPTEPTADDPFAPTALSDEQPPHDPSGKAQTPAAEAGAKPHD